MIYLLVSIVSSFVIDSADTSGIQHVSVPTVVVTDSPWEQGNTPFEIIRTLTFRQMEKLQARVLSDGLCYQPGLRMETNCQTCGYSQLRMNGLPGSYTQILIDGRPLFNSLASLYGLEQIPIALLERVEVTRGALSATYGANAIGGVVNLVTKIPGSASGAIGYQHSSVNSFLPEHFATAWYSMPIEERDGIVGTAMWRRRAAVDLNNDGFSELPMLSLFTTSLNGLFQYGGGDVIKLGLQNIYEFRRGGDNVHLPPHKALQAEDREHFITSASLQYRTVMFDDILITSDLGSSLTYRNHYTGIDGADAYGTTSAVTSSAGLRLSRSFPSDGDDAPILITGGLDVNHDIVKDRIPLYDWDLNQQVFQIAVLGVVELPVTENLSLNAGTRLEKHNKIDHWLLLPRFALRFIVTDESRFVLGYGEGYRGPQAFDADLHIAFAGGGVSYIRFSPDFRHERSRTLTASFQYDYQITNSTRAGFTVESFFTSIAKPFILEETEQLGSDVLLLMRRNLEGNAEVKGVTAELRGINSQAGELSLSLTLQSSHYSEGIRWSLAAVPEKDFLRMPWLYGNAVYTNRPTDWLEVTAACVFTGTMNVPRFAGALGYEHDTVIVSPYFFDITLKSAFRLPSSVFGNPMRISVGAYNLLHSIQRDFDSGPMRDSNYIYGPSRPRTFFIDIELAL